MKRTKRGFTMAEMLITIGIIAILMAFASIPIMGYLRSLHQVEMDAIAKEIFVAAQNHLTMADSQNLTARLFETKNEDGSEKDEATLEYAIGKKEGSDVRYFVVGGDGSDGSYPGNGDKVLDYMLPVASIDDTVRLKGSYVIRYSPSQAKILDVFYASQTGRFSHTFDAGDYATLLRLVDTEDTNNRSARRNCLGGAAIGWYGGEEALNLKKGTRLQPPTVEVINAERLLVRVSYKHTPNASINNDDKINLTLTVTGEQSVQTINGKQCKRYKEFHLIEDGPKSGDPNTFEIVLDDVTQPGKHFADVFYEEKAGESEPSSPSTILIPGENITIQAKLTNNSVLTNVAESSAVKTNSLFADMEIGAGGEGTVQIANIRHLENLHSGISGFIDEPDQAKVKTKYQVKNAVQTAELDWEEFMGKINNETPGTEGYDDVRIYPPAANTTDDAMSAPGCFVPVNMAEGMTYTGASSEQRLGGATVCHVIKNIRTNQNGPAGVFGTLTSCNLSNVTVCNKREYDEGIEILGTGATGGLVGEMTDGKVEGCAAAVYVKSSEAEAGGLIGKATGVTVTESYAGGHTTNGKYLPETEVVASDETHTHWNVQGKTNAGGLIGTVENGSVTNCYSTTSVYGTASTAKAGGFAGSIDKKDDGNAVINGNYCTGLVNAGTETNPGTFGAFAGGVYDPNILGKGNDLNYYYEAVNYDGSTNEALAAVPGKETGENIGRIDKDLNSLNKFYPVAEEQSSAIVYDKPFLEDKYNARYPLLDVTGIGIHYGDWPMMETFVINK